MTYSSLLRLKPKAVSLHTKLMLMLAILITLAVSFVASVLIEHERETRYFELEERADRLADLASHSMAYSVWNVDFVAIDEQLSSLVSDPEVAQCTITAVGYGKMREVIKPMEPLIDPVVRSLDINFATAETGSQKIGEVRVVLTRALVEQAVTEAHRTVWVLVIVILALMYAATFFLFRRVVSAPVNRLEVMVDRIALGDMDVRCIVESGDELGRLAERVNMMADRLSESDRSLRDSENRLKLVLDGSQLGYWDWNIENGVVIRNDRWAEMLGYSLDEIECSIKQWTELHHPDDRKLVWKSITDHLEGRTTAYEFEYRMRTKSGQYKWILDQAKVVNWDSQGKPLRMCGTQRDITERKKAETELIKLSTAVQQSPVVIVITDKNGKIEYVNPKFTDLTGYSYSEVIKQKSYILKSGELNKKVYEDLWKTLLSGKVWRGEFHNTKKNGELFWERASISPIRNSEDEIINYIKISEDISEIKIKEQELELALEKAKESDRLKSAFLANMSHEVRTPMNGILGFASFLKDPQLSGEERDQYIKIIEISGARMLTTINDIIDISRIETGLVKVEKTEVSVNQLLEEQYDFFYKEAQLKGLDLIYKPFLTKKNERIITDQHKLEGILTNLIKNAIKFTKKGKITIGCALKKEVNWELLEFYVEDTGIGIASDRIEAVFNRFDQANVEYSRSYQGSGLGLAISKSYAEMLGGEIRVASEEGAGSTFTLSIPFNNQFKNESDA